MTDEMPIVAALKNAYPGLATKIDALVYEFAGESRAARVAEARRVLQWVHKAGNKLDYDGSEGLAAEAYVVQMEAEGK